jgi:hypothetical protein
MVPPEMRVKRTKKIVALAPAGTSFCAGCQSFRDLVDFGKGATTCRACLSAKTHAAMVAKTYGVTGDDYETLLALQGGKCAICRARPKSKRLAVDHDHKSGAVRGLLCSRCNHDLLGSAWDSLAIAVALWHYLNTPPASGSWLPPEAAPPLVPGEPRKALANGLELARPSDGTRKAPIKSGQGAGAAPEAEECQRRHVIPVGSQAVPGKRGVWRYFVEDGGEAPF